MCQDLTSIRRVRHLDVNDLVKKKEIKIERIDGSWNRGDGFTKPVGPNKLGAFMNHIIIKVNA